MKRLFQIGLLLCATVAFGQSTGTATKITVSGFAAAYPAGTPNCSTSITINCANGYTLTITPPVGVAVVQSIPAGATTFTYTSPTVLNYGTYALSMVTNAIGASGPLTSTATTASTIYAAKPLTVAPAPGGITVTFQ